VKPDQRAFLDSIAKLPPKHRAWLELPETDERAFELWCYYGFGVVVNDAQNQLARDTFIRFGNVGTVYHVAQWANRTGKTTGVTLLEKYAIWRKWRLVVGDLETWLAQRYAWLHAAPLARLTARSWEIADSLIAGSHEAQLSPVTNRPRPGVLRDFFTASSSVNPRTKQEELVVNCANGATVDYFSTHDGAGRLESIAWHGATWDEFARQQPTDDIPLLLDQTFLPRVSDYEGPIILSGTATEDAEYVYLDLADKASQQPHLWNLTTAHRSVNFAMSKRSIERQVELSMNREAAERSVFGRTGAGGGRTFPGFLLENAFRITIPNRTPPPRTEGGWLDFATKHQYWMAFDHGLGGDENAIITLSVPWPPLDTEPTNPLVGHKMTTFKSRRTLTPAEQHEYLADEAALYRPSGIIIDATAEGGLGVYRTARAKGLPAIDCNFAGRAVTHVSNKEFGIQALQELLSYGLEVERDEDGRIAEWPDPKGDFGLIRFPATGDWLRLRNQLLTYRRDDEKLKQDLAMTATMLAWYLWRFIAPKVGRPVSPISKWNMMTDARRARR
jgi:hypothetical protein